MVDLPTQHMRKLFTKNILSLIALTLFMCACSSAYYGMMEKIGIHKRDLLVSRVEAARDSQKEAQKEFKTALEAFKSVTNFKGGDLEDTYEKLRKRLETSEARADEVHKRIESVDDVANALFAEWKDELSSYSSDSLRDASERELKETKVRYSGLLSAMRNAEKRINPVLTPLRDRVMFLKHNLNARAIGSLNSELTSVQSNVDILLADLQRSIDEADSFIEKMGK